MSTRTDLTALVTVLGGNRVTVVIGSDPSISLSASLQPLQHLGAAVTEAIVGPHTDDHHLRVHRLQELLRRRTATSVVSCP